MPLSMVISPMTLYNEDSTIFDDFELPDEPVNHYDDRQLLGYPDLIRPTAQLYAFKRQDFLQYLMLQTAQLSTIYTNPETFATAIKIWSKTRIQIWQELYDTLFFRYNPIWNKDGTVKATEQEVRNFANSLGITGSVTHGKRLVTDHGHPTETLTRTGGHTETTQDSRVQKETHGGLDQRSVATQDQQTDSFNQYVETHQITQDDTTGQVSAFNDSNFANRDKTMHTLAETNTPTGSKEKVVYGTETEGLTHGETVQREVLSGNVAVTTEYGTQHSNGEMETRSYSGDDTETAQESGSTGNSETRTGTDTGTGSKTEERKEQGNIGVTSTQELIQKEREIIKFNLYEYILADFKANFMVLVY